MAVSDISPEPPPSANEGYWQSLFELEESLAEEHSGQAPAEPDVSESVPPDVGANGHPPVTADTTVMWAKADAALKQDALLSLKVTGFNKGGLLVDWEGLQGFVPASQLLDLPNFHIETERIRELKRRQHQVLKLKIIELDRESSRFILSERIADVTAIRRQQLLSNLEPEQRRSGRITNLTRFGAFVDLGGIEGLIHISELSWGRVEHPSQIVQAGDEVEILVLSVDRQKERVALSLKRLQSNPWEGIEERYQPGQLVSGVVSNIVHFGVFIEVEDGLEGLIHISELAEGNFLHPRNVVSLGDKVSARILEVNGGKRRLALSMRAVSDE
jgi:small subunit ribosomal protein S1